MILERVTTEVFFAAGGATAGGLRGEGEGVVAA